MGEFDDVGRGRRANEERTLQDQPWMAWSIDNDIAGRVRLQATGPGAAFDSGTGVASLDDVTPWVDAIGQASGYAREYRYDPGRASDLRPVR